MAANPFRDRYQSDSVATASPARLLTMLYDRLARDLAQAEAALGPDGDPAAAHQPLIHAQEILIELRSSLVTGTWDGAEGLAAVYDWLLGELIAANVRRDLTRVVSCRQLVEPLRQAWHAAAGSAGEHVAAPTA
jgi:flagellar secretion chaperone FliS